MVFDKVFVNLLEFLEKCLPGLFTGILLHIAIIPIFIDVLPILLILIILLVVIISLFKKHDERIINYFNELIKEIRLGKWLKSLLNILFNLIIPLFAGILLGLIIALYIAPPFEITSPKSNDTVNQKITVGGHGAIPGHEIKLFVIVDGQTWPEGITYPYTKGGAWEFGFVPIGNPGDKHKGKIYLIYASTITDSGEVRTKSVDVIRN